MYLFRDAIKRFFRNTRPLYELMRHRAVSGYNCQAV